jgi:hypothetical protein
VNMIRTFENGQQIQNDVIVVTFGSPFKWVFKVSPIRLGRLIEVGFVPCGWSPSYVGKPLHGFLHTPSPKSTWMCLGTKPLEKYSICAP